MKKGNNGKNRGKNQFGAFVNDETNDFHRNQRVSSDEWAQRLKVMLDGLSETESEIVSDFWVKIDGKINYSSGLSNGLGELESLEEKKFNLECYQLIKAIEYLKKYNPTALMISSQARQITYWRNIALRDSLIRQREAIQINAKDYKIQRDDEGNAIEVGHPDPGFDWASLIDSPDIFKMDPEQCFIQAEKYQIIKQIPFLLDSSNKTRTPEYIRIFEALIQGVDVGREHGPILGIDQENIANFKYQLIKCLREIFSKVDPELASKINTYKAQKGKKWKVEKSTAKERKALFRDPYFEEPGKIKHYKVIEGKLVYLGEINPSPKRPKLRE